ncbi:MAG: two-component regulator propeller domain-containing protein [Desulfopila sp.]|jgi:PAS domain S-box-containing protein|nr:two-component regulator propeller domain-containing protein [Desulfopila sp.]
MSRSSLFPLVIFLTVSLFHAQDAFADKRGTREPWFEEVFDSGAYNMAIIQDREGFLWLTTTGGLIRYDGYEKLVFTEGPDGLTSNFVPCVFEDSDGLIWIVTLSGLDMYDKTTGTITHIQPQQATPNPTEKSITFNWAPRLIAEDTTGDIWIGSTTGLLRHDKKLNTLTKFPLIAEGSSTTGIDSVWTVLADRKGRIWTGTSAGLDRFDPSKQEVTHFRHNPEIADSLGAGIVYAVYEDAQGTIWIGTGKGGLNRYIEEQETFLTYSHDPADPHSIADDEVFSITSDSSGSLWLGRTFSTGIGLEKFDPRTERFTLYTHDPSKEGTLSGNIILRCYEDRSGILWVPENTGTVNKIDPYSHRFTLHHADPGKPETQGLSGLTSVYQDSRGDIWTGGQKGLSRYDSATRKWSTYAVDPQHPELLWNSYAFSVLEDSRGDFWVATDDGYLNLFDRDSGEVIERFANPYVHNTARQMIEDRTLPGRFWFGVEGHGLFSFNRDTAHFSRFASDAKNPMALGNEYVYSLLQNDDGIIWLQTQGGLHQFNPKTEKFQRYTHNTEDPQSISSNVVNDIYIDRRGTLWVSTDNGLNRFNRKTETFTTFNQTHGFTTPIIRAILEDDSGMLWLGSNSGLFVFDPRTEKVLNNYTKDDGLQGDSFSLYGSSAMKDREGRLWFAGLNGINSFHPDQLRHNSNPPPVYLLSLSQGGEELVPRLLIGSSESLSLDWKHNYFEFEYVGLNYSQPQKNQYRYMLEGWDNDWFFAGNKRFGRYSGLSGGNYILKVSASNNDGIWSNTPTQLHIHIGTPLWGTWWFYTLLVLGASAFFMLFYLVRVRQLTRFNSELEAAYKGVQMAENKYRSIFENAMDGIYQLTDQGTLTSANPAAASIMGFSTTEEMKKAMVNTRLWTNCSDTEWRKLVVQLFRDGAVTNYELPVRTKDGNALWLAVNLRVISDETNHNRYIDGLMKDITTRRHTSEQLRLYRAHLEQLVDERTLEYQKINNDLEQEIQQRKRIEEELLQAKKLESIGVLAGGIAHDFNNLLTVILGNINMAQLKADKNVTEELGNAIEGLNRARKLTEKFITFSSGGDPVKEILDIEKVTRSAVNFVLSGSSLQARFNCGVTLHRVNADKGHLDQAMNNIVENSKQAMPDGGILDIRIYNYREEKGNTGYTGDSKATTDEYVAIDFIDHGSGITPQDLPRVFDPYFTTAEFGNKKGKGLGLTIAYSIVKKHGGTLSIDSTPGKGTRVRMLLPGVLEEKLTAPRKKNRLPGTPVKILLMDDEEMLRDLTEAMIHQLGHEIDTVADGATAVTVYSEALARNECYDIVILDLTIPGGMGGKETVKMLHQIDPGVKAIVSSGYSSDPMVSHYRDHGFIEVLSKPYDMTTLKETLDSILAS